MGLREDWRPDAAARALDAAGPAVVPRPNGALTHAAHPGSSSLRFSKTMGQQLNKHIKRKRRAAYLKRKKERTKVAAKKK
jgi:hypothetical protein